MAFHFFGKKIYFLGIGGVSMSALAVMMQSAGFSVRGFDEQQGAGTKICEENGIDVDFCLNEAEIAASDLIVASSAIREDDIQVITAKKYHKKICSRGELLGFISNQFENVIAVAGSHGKTTTTAMIFEILKAAGFDPTLHLGGYRCEDGKNFHLGGRQFFVTEACEYHNNFLYLHPHIAVVTNVEKEHLDFFKTFENQKRSFAKFKKQSSFVVEDVDVRAFSARNLRHDAQGGLMFTLFENEKKILSLHMHICEEVNVQNVMYAFVVAKKLGISNCVIKSALEKFRGVGTRFERKLCPYFDVCICDYAHHPTEIAKAIQSAQKIFKDKTLVTVFQPHTYSRTQTLLPQFLKVFSPLEHPIFFRTYSAREKESQGLSALQFCEIVQKNNQNARYFDDFSSLAKFLKQFSKEDTALLFVGAGDLPSILEKEKFVFCNKI